MFSKLMFFPQLHFERKHFSLPLNRYLEGEGVAGSSQQLAPVKWTLSWQDSIHFRRTA
jgi:hypothetical protein